MAREGKDERDIKSELCGKVRVTIRRGGVSGATKAGGVWGDMDILYISVMR